MSVVRSGQYIPRPKSKQCFTRSLGALKNLKILALEYSHVADGTGAAILGLLPVIKKPHFHLQLICREGHTPDRANPELGAGGLEIPDSAWRRITICCPNLYLLMAFVGVRHYDNIIRFLPLSTPVCELHVQMGIDLKFSQRQDSDVSCIIRLIAYRYSNTLVRLSIHQWSFATFPLRRVVELMPHLVCFYYAGRVEDDVDLRRMFNYIACGVCNKMKEIKIQIQTDEIHREYWNNSVSALNDEYSDIMDLYDIDFSVEIYKN